MALKLLDQGKKEKDKLLQLKRDHINNESAKWNSWDSAFYANLQKE